MPSVPLATPARRPSTRAVAILGAAAVGALAIALAALVALRDTSSDNQDQRQAGRAGDASAHPEATPSARATQFAVVYEITPLGDLCKPPDFQGVAERLLRSVEQAGLPGQLVQSQAYADQGSDGWCVEYGRYDTNRDAEAALEETRDKLEDPELVNPDGLPAKVVEVIDPTVDRKPSRRGIADKAELPADETSSGDVTAWPEGESAWTVFLGAFSNEDNARNEAEKAGRYGQVGVLFTGDYASLTPGYYSVFAGQYDTLARARVAEAEWEERGFRDAFSKRVDDGG